MRLAHNNQMQIKPREQSLDQSPECCYTQINKRSLNQIVMKILTAEQMRQIDRECARQGTPTSVLMENAGKAVAEETRRSLGTLENQHILCLIGPGNNGGDGLVAARYLHDWGARVSLYLCMLAARACSVAASMSALFCLS